MLRRPRGSCRCWDGSAMQASRASRLNRRMASRFFASSSLMHLDGDRPRQSSILRLVHDAHAAAAQRTNDIEMRQLLADHGPLHCRRDSGLGDQQCRVGARVKTAPTIEPSTGFDTACPRAGAWTATRRRRVMLIARALPSVRRWARGRLPPYARSDANTEDVVQDVFLRTLRRLAVSASNRRRAAVLPAASRRQPRSRSDSRRSKRRGVQADRVPIPCATGNRRHSRRRSCAQQLDRLSGRRCARCGPPTDKWSIWRIELGYTADEIAAKLGKSKAATANDRLAGDGATRQSHERRGGSHVRLVSDSRLRRLPLCGRVRMEKP